MKQPPDNHLGWFLSEVLVDSCPPGVEALINAIAKAEKNLHLIAGWRRLSTTLSRHIGSCATQHGAQL